MPPEATGVFDLVARGGAVAVALLALYWSRQDKAAAVEAFTALNAERKQLQERANEVIQNLAVELALQKDKLREALGKLEQQANRRDNGGGGE